MRALHSPQYQSFVAVLVAVRHDVGITQTELARRLGKPQSYISKIERSERRLDVPEFIAYARGLGRDPANLLRRMEREVSGLHKTS